HPHLPLVGPLPIKPGPNSSNRYPTFLIRNHDLTLRDRIGIVENQNGSFKANIMLAKCLAVLMNLHSNRIAGHYKEQCKDLNLRCPYSYTYISRTHITFSAQQCQRGSHL